MVYDKNIALHTSNVFFICFKNWPFRLLNIKTISHCAIIFRQYITSVYSIKCCIQTKPHCTRQNCIVRHIIHNFNGSIFP